MNLNKEFKYLETMFNSRKYNQLTLIYVIEVDWHLNIEIMCASIEKIDSSIEIVVTNEIL
jgi:hypothetical protein